MPHKKGHKKNLMYSKNPYHDYYSERLGLDTPKKQTLKEKLESGTTGVQKLAKFLQTLKQQKALSKIGRHAKGGIIKGGKRDMFTQQYD
jgi:hypothetical protein